MAKIPPDPPITPIKVSKPSIKDSVIKGKMQKVQAKPIAKPQVAKNRAIVKH